MTNFSANTVFHLTLHMDKSYKLLGISVDDKRAENYGLKQSSSNEKLCKKGIKECENEHTLQHVPVLLTCTSHENKIETLDVKLHESSIEQIDKYISKFSKETKSTVAHYKECEIYTPISLHSNDGVMCSTCLLRDSCGLLYSE